MSLALSSHPSLFRKMVSPSGSQQETDGALAWDHWESLTRDYWPGAGRVWGTQPGYAKCTQPEGPRGQARNPEKVAAAIEEGLPTDSVASKRATETRVSLVAGRAPARACQCPTPSRSHEQSSPPVHHWTPSLWATAGWRKRSVDLERQMEYPTLILQCWILVSQPPHCHPTALDIQMERRAKTQGLQELHCLEVLHSHPFPRPSEQAGLAPPHSLRSQFLGTQRSLTLETETPTVGFSATTV